MKAKKVAKKAKKKDVECSWMTDNCLYKNLKNGWSWLSSKSNLVLGWVDKRKDKVESLTLVLLGLVLLCPSVNPWTVVSVLILLLGLVRSLSAWR